MTSINPSDAASSTHRSQRALAVAMLASAALTLLLTGCKSPEADAQPAAAQEAVLPVVVTNLSDSPASARVVTATGTLGGKEEVQLAFKIGGIVEQVHVDAGQRVRAGQVLATLRPTEIAAQVRTASEGRAKAQRDLDRARQLYGDSVATLQQLQDATTALTIAQQQERIARFNADFAAVRAASDGVVLQRLAEPGQVIEPGRPVLAVRSAARGMVVRAGVADRLAVQVTEGDTATVVFDAMAGQAFRGRVTRRAAAATQGTGSYQLEITLGRDAAALPSGLVGTVTVWLRSTARASASPGITVPTDALVDADADSGAVFVLADDARTVRRVPVRLGDIATTLAEGTVPVLDGLTGAERVVTAGTSRLVNGSRVRVVTATGSAAP
jgi:RND family efflux transporter MFP subunit